MHFSSKDEFLNWATRQGLELDPRYPHASDLTFRGGSDARFWEDLMEDWQSCYVWRHLGGWPALPRDEPRRINDAVEYQILRGLGLPMGTKSVVKFDRSEYDPLISLLLMTTIFGFSTYDDLCIVPDHAGRILKTDHHGVVHVVFRPANEADEIVAAMSSRGFELPEELPDETFKRPRWMS